MKGIYLLIAILVALASACAGANYEKLTALADEYQSLADKPIVIDFRQGDYKVKFDLKKNIAEIKLFKSNFLLSSRAIDLFDPALLLQSNNVRLTLSHSF